MPPLNSWCGADLQGLRCNLAPVAFWEMMTATFHMATNGHSDPLAELFKQVTLALTQWKTGTRARHPKPRSGS
jgi:hypothetical protein